MSFIKRLCILLLTVCCLVPLLASASYAKESSSPQEMPLSLPTVSAKAAFLCRGDNQDAIYCKNADLPLPMASTTKIMTALVAIQSADPELLIETDPRAVGTEGSSIYLFEKETLTLRQLLYALLLESANDAAVAIACGIAGSVEAFADRMNETARSLGLSSTHFTNPHGLDDTDHFTTARELAIIASAAMKEPLFREIVSTKRATIPHAESGGVRVLGNHNKLLSLYDGCIGVKTGFTKKSGRCLVSAAERNGVILIAVTLDAPNDWNDHTAMLDYGFSLFTSVSLCTPASVTYPLSVVGGTGDSVLLTNRESLFVTLPREHGGITQTIEAPRFTYAEVYENDILGQAVFWCDTDGDGCLEMIAQIPLYAEASISKAKKPTLLERIRSLFEKGK